MSDLKTHPVYGRRANLLQLPNMLYSCVTLVVQKAIVREYLIVNQHNPVPEKNIGVKQTSRFQLRIYSHI